MRPPIKLIPPLDSMEARIAELEKQFKRYKPELAMLQKRLAKFEERKLKHGRIPDSTL